MPVHNVASGANFLRRNAQTPAHLRSFIQCTTVDMVFCGDWDELTIEFAIIGTAARAQNERSSNALSPPTSCPRMLTGVPKILTRLGRPHDDS